MSSTLLPLAVWSIARALKSSRTIDFAIAILASAGMMLANMFGFVLVTFLVITIPLSLDRSFRHVLLLKAGLIVLAAYALVSPWITPSLLKTIRVNEAANGELASPLGSVAAFVAIALCLWVVWRLSRRYDLEWPARWMLLFGAAMICIPVFGQCGLHFLPQPERYKIEAELAIVWLAVFALNAVPAASPRWIRTALLLPLVFLSGQQMLSFRRIASAFI